MWRCAAGVRSATAGADDVFLDRTSALSMLRSTGSKRHYDSIGGAYHTGIVCECCVHKCSLRELQAYCSAKCPSGSAASLSAPAGRPKRIGGGGGGSGDDQHPYPAHQQSQPPASGHQHQWHVHQQQQQHLLAPQPRYTVAGGAGAGADEDGEASEQQARLGNASPPSRLLHPHIQPHRSSSPADDVINELLLTTWHHGAMRSTFVYNVTACSRQQPHQSN